MNPTIIENLGKLAAKCEIEAANQSLTRGMRAYLQNLASRYREAQYDALITDREQVRYV
jgi:hypothetical protein